MNRIIRSGKVIDVGDEIDGSARNAANPAFLGRVDCNGREIKVILKIEPAHRLAKELIATSLASIVGIQHAPGLIGVIDPTDLNRFGGCKPFNSKGRHLCFASEKRSGSALSSLSNAFLQSQFAVELLVFDQLIANFDRPNGNVLEGEGTYWAFDHDKILFEDTARWSGLPVSRNEDAFVGINFAFNRPDAVFAAKRTASEFNQKISEEPLDFLNEIAEFELFSHADASALRTFFLERSKALPSIVETFFAIHT